MLTTQLSTSPFEEIPHETRFFYRDEPWFIPLAARYYRLLDWVSQVLDRDRISAVLGILRKY